jgi:hypothetical protein
MRHSCLYDTLGLALLVAIIVVGAVVAPRRSVFPGGVRGWA